MSESFPVFRSKGQFDLEPSKGAEMVGAILQMADGLYEGYYYAFKVGERSVGIADSLKRTLVLFAEARKRFEL